MRVIGKSRYRRWQIVVMLVSKSIVSDEHGSRALRGANLSVGGIGGERLISAMPVISRVSLF